MTNNLLVRSIYPLLECLFPKQWAEKLKMCGLILTGNWMFFNYNYFQIENLNSEKIRSFFSALRQEDINMLLRFCEQYKIARRIQECPDLRYSILLKTSAWFTKNEISQRKLEIKELEKIKRSRKYILPLYAIETVLYRHGLYYLQKKQCKYLEGKIILDIGAFDGASNVIFQQYKPECVISIEPSHKNRETIAKVMENNHIPEKSFKILPFGISDQEGNIAYSDSGDSGNTLTGTGMDRIKLTTVDKICETISSPVGLIKADIEGYGLKMIKGAIKTICRDRPILSLSIYHNADEFFGIYDFLKKLNLNYEFRIYPLCKAPLGELILFAYPQK